MACRLSKYSLLASFIANVAFYFTIFSPTVRSHRIPARRHWRDCAETRTFAQWMGIQKGTAIMTTEDYQMPRVIFFLGLPQKNRQQPAKETLALVDQMRKSPRNQMR